MEGTPSMRMSTYNSVTALSSLAQSIFRSPQRSRIPSRQSHTLHLDLHPLRQLLNGHTAPRRLRVPKVQFVFPIHVGEILHIRQEDRHLDHLAQVTAGFFQDLVDVLDAEGGFVGYRSGRQGAVCQGGQLAGDVDCVRGTDGLGVWACY